MRPLQLLFGIALAATLEASAQDTGTLGDMANGTINVSVEISQAAPQISITNLSDINFDKTDGDTALLDQKISACVYIDQEVMYTATVAAGPLTSAGGQSYAYEIEVDQNLATSSSMTLSVSETTVTKSMMNLTPSLMKGCPGTRPMLELTFKDKGTDTVVAPFMASNTVVITVSPQ